MATGTIHLNSSALEGMTTYSIILPEPEKAGPGPYPVLLQLHGMHDDHTAWLEKSRIWVYVERLPLIVVMPSGGNFWWSNLRMGPLPGIGDRGPGIGPPADPIPGPRSPVPATDGLSLNYEDYLVRDLWEHVQGSFPARPGARWAIGGLSMGGFGA